jgi:Autophagy receptor ATG43
MASNPATEIASAIQSASIKRHPSPHHDINPSTAASKKVPVREVSPAPSDVSDIPSSDLIQPVPRRTQFPPLPDFRFEQSYLASIKSTETNSQVAIITIRDQVILPLAQGILWNLALFGWRYWNRDVKFRGESLGARVRKWWWGVNNWKLPSRTEKEKFATGAEEVSLMSKFSRLLERRSV